MPVVRRASCPVKLFLLGFFFYNCNRLQRLTPFEAKVLFYFSFQYLGHLEVKKNLQDAAGDQRVEPSASEAPRCHKPPPPANETDAARLDRVCPQGKTPVNGGDIYPAPRLRRRMRKSISPSSGPIHSQPLCFPAFSLRAQPDLIPRK